MKSLFQKFRSFAAVALLGVVALFAGSPAFAQSTGTGLASGVSTYISSAGTDVTTIGVAVLAVIVIVAAIGWVARAMRK